MDTNKTIDTIVENLFYALPVIHKRLMRIDPPKLESGLRLTRLHVGILAALHDEESATESEIANNFLTPKSQMSHLIDRMTGDGLVERTGDKNDRRITRVKLTERGKQVFVECDQAIKNNVRTMLSSLTQSELTDLAESVAKLKEIGPKLDKLHHSGT
jgi:MarR family transcriptional regulator, organic hydroperoxide resistance regulator